MWERARAPSPRWRVPRTKVVPPRLQGHFVHRDELRNRLAWAAVSTDLTLVCAPAGYGKSLLLADWVAATGCSDKAWVSLDCDDDSAEHFLAAVLCAIREHARIPVTDTLPDHIMPPGDDIAGAVAELVDAIEAVPGRICLVLDNVQEVPSRGALRVLTALIQNQPQNLRLVLACRSDPPTVACAAQPVGSTPVRISWKPGSQTSTAGRRTRPIAGTHPGRVMPGNGCGPTLTG